MAIQLDKLFALSVRQPWAWALIFVGKDIENRKWNTKFRGTVAIHAAFGMTAEEYQDAEAFMIMRGIRLPPAEDLVRGAIIGFVDIVDVVQSHPSPWFEGKYGFVVTNPHPLLKPIACKGALGF